MAKNIPDFKTERLILRNIACDDAHEIVRWRSDPAVYRFFLNPHPITLEEHLDWYNNRYLSDATRLDWIAVGSQEEKIGVFGLKIIDSTIGTAEINYIIAPEFRKRGYATEALNALLKLAKDYYKIKAVIAEIHKDNIDSINLAVKLGMEYTSIKDNFTIYSISL